MQGPRSSALRAQLAELQSEVASLRAKCKAEGAAIVENASLQVTT